MKRDIIEVLKEIYPNNDDFIKVKTIIEKLSNDQLMQLGIASALKRSETKTVQEVIVSFLDNFSKILNNTKNPLSNDKKSFYLGYIKEILDDLCMFSGVELSSFDEERKHNTKYFKTQTFKDQEERKYKATMRIANALGDCLSQVYDFLELEYRLKVPEMPKITSDNLSILLKKAVIDEMTSQLVNEISDFVCRYKLNDPIEVRNTLLDSILHPFATNDSKKVNFILESDDRITAQSSSISIGFYSLFLNSDAEMQKALARVFCVSNDEGEPIRFHPYSQQPLSSRENGGLFKVDNIKLASLALNALEGRKLPELSYDQTLTKQVLDDIMNTKFAALNITWDVENEMVEALDTIRNNTDLSQQYVEVFNEVKDFALIYHLLLPQIAFEDKVDDLMTTLGPKIKDAILAISQNRKQKVIEQTQVSLGQGAQVLLNPFDYTEIMNQRGNANQSTAPQRSRMPHHNMMAISDLSFDLLLSGLAPPVEESTVQSATERSSRGLHSFAIPQSELDDSLRESETDEANCLDRSSPHQGSRSRQGIR